MMVVAIIALLKEFESCRAITEIISFHNFHVFKEVHRAVNRSEITIPFWE